MRAQVLDARLRIRTSRSGVADQDDSCPCSLQISRMDPAITCGACSKGCTCGKPPSPLPPLDHPPHVSGRPLARSFTSPLITRKLDIAPVQFATLAHILHTVHNVRTGTSHAVPSYR